MMRYLLDSHMLLWAAHDSPKLPRRYADIINSSANTLYFSRVSLWELAIKRTVGKLEIEDSFFTLVQESGYNSLSITPVDLLAYINLPLQHRDPFDRMLVAQAKSQGMPLLTMDEKIRRHYADVITLL